MVTAALRPPHTHTHNDTGALGATARPTSSTPRTDDEQIVNVVALLRDLLFDGDGQVTVMGRAIGLSRLAVGPEGVLL